MEASTETNTNRKATGNGKAGDSEFIVTEGSVKRVGPKGDGASKPLDEIMAALGDDRLNVYCLVKHADTGVEQRVSMYIQTNVNGKTNTPFLGVYGFDGRTKSEIAAEHRATAAEDALAEERRARQALEARLTAAGI
jgi:hypothetical protein